MSGGGGAASGSEEPQQTPPAASASNGTSENVRHRRTGSQSGAETVKDYTSDQLEAVRKVRKCKDYYEILGVDKECSDEDLKKAYRKLALKFHPDKNKAPGATEAFKAIGNAFAVLNDAEKRRRYDQFGSEADQVPSHRHHSHGGYHEYDYTRGGFEGDISAEELFNMFFGGGFNTGHVRTRRTFRNTRSFNRSEQNESQVAYMMQIVPILFLVAITLISAFLAHDPYFSHHKTSFDCGMVVEYACVTADVCLPFQSPYTFLLQLSPLLFMVVISLLSSFLVSDPLYSLQRSGKYTFERKSQNLNIPYFVKPDFSTDYKGSIKRLEQQIEEEYISNLRSNCYRERSYKESMLWRARNFGDRSLYQKAQDMKTPACDNLQKIYGG